MLTGPDLHPDRWRWLATPDERVLWTMVLAIAVLLMWGAWSAWSRGRSRA